MAKVGDVARSLLVQLGHDTCASCGDLITVEDHEEGKFTHLTTGSKECS